MCKFDTDDSYYTQEHILYLISKYRAFIFQQKYGNNNIKKQIPEVSRQQICIELMPVPGNKITVCDSGFYLRSTRPIPDIMPYTKPLIYTDDVYSTISQIIYVYYDRMKYTGENKYMKNIIYSSISPDKYLYLKSQNPVFLNLERIKMSAVFNDIEEAMKLSCDPDCDILDSPFPLEDNLIPMLIDTVVKELLPKIEVPQDEENNATDNQNEQLAQQNGAGQ